MYATVSELKELKEWLLGGCKDINEQPRTKLKKQIKRLNNVVSNKASAIKKLQQANQALMYQLNQSKAIVTRLESEKGSYTQGTTKEIFTMPQVYTYEAGKSTILGTVYHDDINIELQKENQALKETNDSLNSELNDIKQVLKQSNTELKDELNLKNEVLEMQANLIKSLEATIKDFQADKTRLQETNNKLNQDNQRLYNQNNNLGVNLVKVNNENDNLRAKVYELENLDNEEIKKLSKEIDNINLENSKVWNKNRELEETSKKFIDLQKEYESEISELKNSLQKYKDFVQIRKFS